MDTPLASSPQPSPRKRMSLQTLIADGTRAVTRFPMGFAYLVALCLWLLILTWLDNQPGDNVCIAFSYCLTVGLLLSLDIPLWTSFAGKPRLSRPIQGGANAILAADFIFLLMHGSALGMAGWISHISVVTALTVALLFVPDRRRGAAAWYYSYAQITNLITTAIISLAMWLAAALIYGTVDLLFGVHTWKLMPTLGIIFALFVPLTIFMGRIPPVHNIDAAAGGHTLSRFERGLIKFLLMPLALIYMGILYAYGFKILFTFTLPVGMVVYPVTGFTAVCLLLIFLLERTDDDPVIPRIRRALPIAMLPLLVLMSVSVLYRIGEYGITVSRLYVLTFNLWAYGAMIYLIVIRNRRFYWVPMSFALLFVAVSIIPGANYTSLTYSYMQSRVMDAFTRAGATAFPLDREQVAALRDKLPDADWTLLSSRLEYIDDHRDHSYTAHIVSFPVRTSSWETDELFDTDIVDIEAVSPLVEYDFEAKESISIPEGYTYVSRQSFTQRNFRVDNPLYYEAPLTDSLTLALDIRWVCNRTNGAALHRMRIPLADRQMDDAMFVPTSVTCRYDSAEYADSGRIQYFSISGLLFTEFNISK